MVEAAQAREVRGFLDCGILARGFIRVHCDACGKDRVVAFSCKGRSFCPSYGGRRMADTAPSSWIACRGMESGAELLAKDRMCASREPSGWDAPCFT